MALQAITLHLPEDVYQRLQHMARATQRPLEDVILQTIRGNLLPVVDDLPPEWQAEWAELSNLSDEALWRVARKPRAAEQWPRQQFLLRKLKTGLLTDAQRAELDELRDATGRFVRRRSHALALLKWRGHTLPVPET